MLFCSSGCLLQLKGKTKKEKKKKKKMNGVDNAGHAVMAKAVADIFR